MILLNRIIILLALLLDQIFKDPINKYRPVVAWMGNLIIQVRDCSSFGLQNYILICTRKHDENQQLLKAMKELA